jgi:hypothetical protein
VAIYRRHDPIHRQPSFFAVDWMMRIFA